MTENGCFSISNGKDGVVIPRVGQTMGKHVWREGEDQESSWGIRIEILSLKSVHLNLENLKRPPTALHIPRKAKQLKIKVGKEF